MAGGEPRVENYQFASPTGLGKIALTGFGLGSVLSIHLCILIYNLWWLNEGGKSFLIQWSVYAVYISWFHFSEGMATALWKPSTFNYDSFILNHSFEYRMAALASWVEFWVELFLFPSFKTNFRVFCLGVVVAGLGQLLRTLSMWTAGSNFSHRIEAFKRKDHRLVTHGVYRFMRHPSYCGWFWWSVGSQLILCNPICFVAYTWASWNFFKDRIPFEEEILMQFFPDEYPAYKARTISGVPFIR